MKLKEKISIEDLDGTTFKIRLVEAIDNGKAAFTHYVHNYNNDVAKFFKIKATDYIRQILEYKNPSDHISNIITEEALQYLLFDFKNKSVPFPEPQKYNFTFIDLFAGIGGIRLAFQNLGGKCVFTSEWDTYSKKTYEANFGEVPYGDITKISENEIPNHDILLAGFPCQPFSIAA